MLNVLARNESRKLKHLFTGYKIRWLLQTVITKVIYRHYKKEGLNLRTKRPLRHRSFAKELGLKPATTPVTSPQIHGMAESFVKTLKRYYAKLASRSDSKTMVAQLKDRFDDYNSYHPHSALGYLPPKLFREKVSVT